MPVKLLHCGMPQRSLERIILGLFKNLSLKLNPSPHLLVGIMLLPQLGPGAFRMLPRAGEDLPTIMFELIRPRQQDGGLFRGRCCGFPLAAGKCSACKSEDGSQILGSETWTHVGGVCLFLKANVWPHWRGASHVRNVN